MSVSNTQIVVEAIETPDSLNKLSDVWNELLCESASDTVFLTWQWQKSWVNTFLNESRKLLILCVRKSQEVVAIAPWYVEKVRRGIFTIREVRFIGAPESGADYLDVIMRPGKEKEATEAIYSYLSGPGGEKWDELRLGDIPSESLFLLHFLRSLEELGKYVELRRHAYLPQIKLPGNAESYFDTLSSNRRYIFGRDLRRLQKETTVEHVTYSGECLEGGFERFFRLYDEKSGYSDGPGLNNFLRKFSDSEPGSQWAQIDLLTTGKEDIAGLLHLRYKQNLAMLKMVVEKNYSRRVSIGNLLVGMTIKNAINSGIECYDFLKGHEEYKFHWAKNGRSSLSIIFPQKRVIPLLVTVSRLMRYLAKLILR